MQSRTSGGSLASREPSCGSPSVIARPVDCLPAVVLLPRYGGGRLRLDGTRGMRETGNKARVPLSEGQRPLAPPPGSTCPPLVRREGRPPKGQRSIEDGDHRIQQDHGSPPRRTRDMLGSRLLPTK